MQLIDRELTPELLQDFRNTFLTPHGRRVFTFLLFALGFFRTDIDTPQESWLRNFAAKLVQIMGANKPVGAFWTADALLDNLVHVPIDKPKALNGNGIVRFSSLHGEVVRQ